MLLVTLRAAADVRVVADTASELRDTEDPFELRDADAALGVREAEAAFDVREVDAALERTAAVFRLP